MIERNLTEVRSIIIELGDFKAHMTVIGTRNWIPHPRGGDVHDLHGGCRPSGTACTLSTST